MDMQGPLGQGTEKTRKPTAQVCGEGMTMGVESTPHVCLVLSINAMCGTKGQAPPFYFNCEIVYTLTSESFILNMKFKSRRHLCLRASFYCGEQPWDPKRTQLSGTLPVCH